MAAQITLVVADDHPAYRAGLRALFETDPHVRVAGEAANGEEALELARELEPDVVLLDVQMPGMSGLDAARRISHEVPGAAILMLTMIEDDDTLLAAMRAGARGYLLKDAGREELRRAIEAAAGGESIFGAAVAGRVRGMLAAGADAAVAVRPFPELTDRELEILALVARGFANGAIAARLGLREKTIRNNVSAILTKLRVVDRSQAIVRAREAGLGT